MSIRERKKPRNVFCQKSPELNIDDSFCLDNYIVNV